MLQDSIHAALFPVEHLASCLGHSDKNDQIFRYDILRKLPSRFIKPVTKRYQKIYKKQGRRESNLMLLNIEKRLKGESLRLNQCDEELRFYAKFRAETCMNTLLRIGSLNDAYSPICKLVTRFGLKPVNIGRKHDLYGAVMRMTDEGWWRRALRKKLRRQIESLAIEFGLVRKQAGIYASDEIVASRIQQKTRNSKMLNEMVAVNENGDSYTLRELQELSVANPVNRRNELMTRISGFEEYALKHGHVGEFITFTCPSRMHARMSKSGDENPKHDNTKPDEAQDYMNKQWSKMRAAIARLGIHIYGFRVAEPQHDATPHWHLLIFMEPEHVSTVLNIMRHYALEIDGNEKGAQKHRYTSKSIDWSKGTAAGYIAKYISKNIDGYKVGEDLYGNDAIESSQRVDAWASTWSIRQFQQLGGPPVTLWRVLRKLDELPENGIALDIYNAADNGDWCEYMELMGGHTATRQDWPIGLAKENIDALNKYGEPIGSAIVGIVVGQTTYRSTTHIWEIFSRPENYFLYTENSSTDESRNVTETNPVTRNPVTGISREFEDGDSCSGKPIGSGTGPELSGNGAGADLNLQVNNAGFLKKGPG